MVPSPLFYVGCCFIKKGPNIVEYWLNVLEIIVMFFLMYA